MKLIVHIRNNATGEVRQWKDPLDWEPEDARFMWTDGNYGCDCNRADFFADAGGDIDPDTPCGETAYSVLYLEFDNGTQIPIDNAT